MSRTLRRPRDDYAPTRHSTTRGFSSPVAGREVVVCAGYRVRNRSDGGSPGASRHAQFTPNVAFFLESFGDGYTFGEAAWASQLAVSWPAPVIGDRLDSPVPPPPPD